MDNTAGKNVTVSVFIPYYNDKAFIKESIDSVLGQSFGDFELLLLNHASTDGTRELVHSYQDKRIVHIDAEKNIGGGGGVLMDMFMEHAKGKYIKFFCADDVMLPDCLEKLVGYLESNPMKDIVFSDLKYVDENCRETGDIWSTTRPCFCFSNTELDLFRFFINGTNPLPYPTVLVKRELLKKVYVDHIVLGMFDMFLWASLLVNNAKFGFITDILALYRMHENQICTSKKWNQLVYASGFESYIYTRIFQKVTNPDFINYLAVKTKLDTHFDMDDADNIKYAVGRFYLMHEEFIYKHCGFMVLHELLQDPATRHKIASNFRFDIGELREIYRTPLPRQSHSRVLRDLFKGAIAAKQPLELSFSEISLLALRKVYQRMKKILRREQETPKYTV